MAIRVVLCCILMCALAAVQSDAQSLVPTISKASCVLSPTVNAAYLPNLSGSFAFVQANSTITVTGVLSGLGSSSDLFSYRIMAFGTWSADGSAAGGNLFLMNGTALSSAQPIISFTDSVISLNGPNSVIGRSILLFNSVGSAVAQCVIGRDDSYATESAAPLVPDGVSSAPTRASCRFVGTSNAPGASGWMTFESVSGGLSVRWAIAGLSATTPGNGHTMYIHQAGNITDSALGLSVLGHFIGNCSSCRPANLPQEVGLIGNGYTISVGSGSVATGQLTDSVMSLRGMASIIGRAVMIHGTVTDPLASAAQCVIGIDQPSAAPTALAPVTSATCSLRSTATFATSGYLTLEQQSTGLNVRYVIGGLATGSHLITVHRYGELLTDDSTFVSPIFVGSPCASQSCRPLASSSMQALGYLNNGVPLATSASGVADGSFSDPLVSLSGVDSLIGRSIAIHQNTTMASPIIGHCVIGRSMQNAAFADTISPSSAASCRFSATTAGVNAFNLASPSGIDGHLTFTQSDPSQPLAASMSVFGLGVGSHPFHVHVGGDLIDADEALSVSGHFAGSVSGSTPLRPSCPAANQNEVGALNNCVAISTSGAVSTAAFYDSFAALSGFNNIVGRSIVIHLSAANATRVAQCVIGRTADVVSNTPAASSTALSTWLTWVIGIAVGLFVGAVAMAFVCRRRVALANSSADVAMSVGKYEHHTDTV